MQLTATLQLNGYDSLQQLSTSQFPVRPNEDGQRAFIDVIVGLRQVEVAATPPLSGWRQLLDEETRFEIDQDTTGAQLAAAFADATVIHAIEQVICPPVMNRRNMSKQEIAQLTGSETFDESVANLIDALGKHMTVLREKPAHRRTPIQASLL